MTTNLEASDLAVIDRQVNEAFPIWKRLNKNQYLFLLLSLTITAALWFAGSAAEGSKLRAFSEPLHDFALFVFSLGFFDSIKEFFFKEDYEKQKKELLDIITTRFLREMDAFESHLILLISRKLYLISNAVIHSTVTMGLYQTFLD